MKKQSIFLILFSLLMAFTASCSKSDYVKKKEDAENIWGAERVCLPCHLTQQPVARRHSYPCTTCHQGNGYATDKLEAHDGLIRAPQAPENIAQACDRCHRRVLGRDVPYNAEFIKDVIVSHKRNPGESLEWQE
jgi:hypothetical protein